MSFLQKQTSILVGMALVVLGSASAAEAATLGGQLFATGGEISVEVLPADAGLTSTLFLLDPRQNNQRVDIATNREVGRIVNLGVFDAGLELVFGIFNGNTFLMGPGSRNSDGISHAQVNFLSPTVAEVGFEDLLGGGDRDYNDNRFRFTGGIKPTTTAAVPEPTTIVGLALAGSGLIAARRRQRQQKASNSAVH